MPGVKKSTAKSSAAKPASKVEVTKPIEEEVSSSPPTPVEEVKETKPVTPAKSTKATAASKKVASPPPKKEEEPAPVEEKKVEPEPAPKKAVAPVKKTETPPSPKEEEPFEEEVTLEACTEEGCARPEGATQETEEIVDFEEEGGYEEGEEQEEFEEEDAEEDGEEEEQVEEVYLEDRNTSVPITSTLSPRHIARTNVMSRALSPRIGDVRSPKRPSNDPRTTKKATNKHGKLEPDDLIYTEEDIPKVVFDRYINVRAADVITFLVAINRCPYVFKLGGIVTTDIEADSAAVVQYSADIEEAFEIFECLQGILAFTPVSDIDFGYDEESAHHLSYVPDMVYICPVISSGPDAGDIRFVDDLQIWGLISLDEYYQIRDRTDYRSYVKSMEMTPLDYIDTYDEEIGEEEETGEEDEE